MVIFRKQCHILPGMFVTADDEQPGVCRRDGETGKRDQGVFQVIDHDVS